MFDFDAVAQQRIAQRFTLGCLEFDTRRAQTFVG
jgi:hypothetical protein